MTDLRILVVCTANVCRSPLAAALLQEALTARQVHATVRSAGTRRVKLPVDPEIVKILDERGIDAGHHQPRVVTPAIIINDGHDLVLTMTREHVRDVVATDRMAWKRTFTLRELVRRAEASDHGRQQHRTARSGHPTASWLEAVGAGRRPIDLLHGSALDDIDDPYGQSRRILRQAAQEIDALCGRLVATAPW